MSTCQGRWRCEVGGVRDSWPRASPDLGPFSTAGAHTLHWPHLIKTTRLEE